MKKIVILGLLASVCVYANTSSAAPQDSWQWTCTPMQITDLYKNKVTWQTLTCDGSLNNKVVLKSLNINVVTAPVNDPEVKFVPYESQTPTQLDMLPNIAGSLNAKTNVLAGINGGYFFRSDVKRFVDNICPYKTVTPPKPGTSMGDSLLQHDGQNFSTNCAFMPGKAENPRASLILSGINPDTGKSAPYITLVKPDVTYTQANNVIPDAIGAGPNLVTDGKLTVNNPDENLIPTSEFAANSAVGIINDASGNPAQLVLFTVDGSDDSLKKGWPGMNATEMADFMLNYLKVSNAISMDQGGSTTMYVGASDLSTFPLHVVSNSDFEPGVPRSERSIRDIYDGLFIAVPKQ